MPGRRRSVSGRPAPIAPLQAQMPKRFAAFSVAQAQQPLPAHACFQCRAFYFRIEVIYSVPKYVLTTYNNVTVCVIQTTILYYSSNLIQFKASSQKSKCMN
jgi:hypothetical protein